MIYEKIGYTDTVNQFYAVGVRKSRNDTLRIIAEFKDVEAAGYNACNEADKLLTVLFNGRSCECGALVYPGDHRCKSCMDSQHAQAEIACGTQ